MALMASNLKDAGAASEVQPCLLLRAPGTGAGECDACVLYAVAAPQAGGSDTAGVGFDFVALPAAAAASLCRSGALRSSGWASALLSPMVISELAWPVGLCAPPEGASIYLPACALQAAVVRHLPLDALCAALGVGGAGKAGPGQWQYDVSFMDGAPTLAAPALLRRLDGSRAATLASLELDLVAWCLLLSEEAPGRAAAVSREKAAAMVAAGVPGELAAAALAQLDARARAWQ